jgi:hypothetical protein
MGTVLIRILAGCPKRDYTRLMTRCKARRCEMRSMEHSEFRALLSSNTPTHSISLSIVSNYGL